jgi:hypothetical protein
VRATFSAVISSIADLYSRFLSRIRSRVNSWSVCALPGLLPRHVVDEGDRVDHELVRGALPLDLAVGEVAVDSHASVGDALERVGDLVERAAEPALLHDDQGLEGRPRPQGVHEGQVAWALPELRPRDPVVGVDMSIGHGPTLACGVVPGALDPVMLFSSSGRFWSVLLRA